MKLENPPVLEGVSAADCNDWALGVQIRCVVVQAQQFHPSSRAVPVNL